MRIVPAQAGIATLLALAAALSPAAAESSPEKPDALGLEARFSACISAAGLYEAGGKGVEPTQKSPASIEWFRTELRALATRTHHPDTNAWNKELFASYSQLVAASNESALKLREACIPAALLPLGDEASDPKSQAELKLLLGAREKLGRALKGVAAESLPLRDRIDAMVRELGRAKAYPTLTKQDKDALSESLRKLTIAHGDLVRALGLLKESYARLQQELRRARAQQAIASKEQKQQMTPGEKLAATEKRLAATQEQLAKKKPGFENEIFGENIARGNDIVEPDQAGVVSLGIKPQSVDVPKQTAKTSLPKRQAQTRQAEESEEDKEIRGWAESLQRAYEVPKDALQKVLSAPKASIPELIENMISDGLLKPDQYKLAKNRRESKWSVYAYAPGLIDEIPSLDPRKRAELKERLDQLLEKPKDDQKIDALGEELQTILRGQDFHREYMDSQLAIEAAQQVLAVALAQEPEAAAKVATLAEYRKAVARKIRAVIEALLADHEATALTQWEELRALHGGFVTQLSPAASWPEAADSHFANLQSLAGSWRRRIHARSTADSLISEISADASRVPRLIDTQFEGTRLLEEFKMGKQPPARTVLLVRAIRAGFGCSTSGQKEECLAMGKRFAEQERSLAELVRKIDADARAIATLLQGETASLLAEEGLSEQTLEAIDAVEKASQKQGELAAQRPNYAAMIARADALAKTLGASMPEGTQTPLTDLLPASAVQATLERFDLKPTATGQRIRLGKSALAGIDADLPSDFKELEGTLISQFGEDIFVSDDGSYVARVNGKRWLEQIQKVSEIGEITVVTRERNLKKKGPLTNDPLEIGALEHYSLQRLIDGKLLTVESMRQIERTGKYLVNSHKNGEWVKTEAFQLDAAGRPIPSTRDPNLLHLNPEYDYGTLKPEDKLPLGQIPSATVAELMKLPMVRDAIEQWDEVTDEHGTKRKRSAASVQIVGPHEIKVQSRDRELTIHLPFGAQENIIIKQVSTTSENIEPTKYVLRQADSSERRDGYVYKGEVYRWTGGVESGYIWSELDIKQDKSGKLLAPIQGEFQVPVGDYKAEATWFDGFVQAGMSEQNPLYGVASAPGKVIAKAGKFVVYGGGALAAGTLSLLPVPGWEYEKYWIRVQSFIALRKLEEEIHSLSDQRALEIVETALNQIKDPAIRDEIRAHLIEEAIIRSCVKEDETGKFDLNLVQPCIDARKNEQRGRELLAQEAHEIVTGGGVEGGLKDLEKQRDFGLLASKTLKGSIFIGEMGASGIPMAGLGALGKTTASIKSFERLGKVLAKTRNAPGWANKLYDAPVLGWVPKLARWQQFSGFNKTQFAKTTQQEKVREALAKAATGSGHASFMGEMGATMIGQAASIAEGDPAGQRSIEILETLTTMWAFNKGSQIRFGSMKAPQTQVAQDSIKKMGGVENAPKTTGKFFAKNAAIGLDAQGQSVVFDPRKVQQLGNMKTLEKRTKSADESYKAESQKMSELRNPNKELGFLEETAASKKRSGEIYEKSRRYQLGHEDAPITPKDFEQAVTDGTLKPLDTIEVQKGNDCTLHSMRGMLRSHGVDISVAEIKSALKKQLGKDGEPFLQRLTAEGLNHFEKLAAFKTIAEALNAQGGHRFEIDMLLDGNVLSHIRDSNHGVAMALQTGDGLHAVYVEGLVRSAATGLEWVSYSDSITGQRGFVPAAEFGALARGWPLCLKKGASGQPDAAQNVKNQRFEEMIRDIAASERKKQTELDAQQDQRTMQFPKMGGTGIDPRQFVSKGGVKTDAEIARFAESLVDPQFKDAAVDAGKRKLRENSVERQKKIKDDPNDVSLRSFDVLTIGAGVHGTVLNSSLKGGKNVVIEAGGDIAPVFSNKDFKLNSPVAKNELVGLPVQPWHIHGKTLPDYHPTASSVGDALWLNAALKDVNVHFGRKALEIVDSQKTGEKFPKRYKVVTQGNDGKPIEYYADDVVIATGLGTPKFPFKDGHGVVSKELGKSWLSESDPPKIMDVNALNYAAKNSTKYPKLGKSLVHRLQGKVVGLVGGFGDSAKASARLFAGGEDASFYPGLESPNPKKVLWFGLDVEGWSQYRDVDAYSETGKQGQKVKIYADNVGEKFFNETIHRVPEHVAEIKPDDDGYLIVMSDGATHRVDFLVVAAGFQSRAKSLQGLNSEIEILGAAENPKAPGIVRTIKKTASHADSLNQQHGWDGGSPNKKAPAPNDQRILESIDKNRVEPKPKSKPKLPSEQKQGSNTRSPPPKDLPELDWKKLELNASNVDKILPSQRKKATSELLRQVDELRDAVRDQTLELMLKPTPDGEPQTIDLSTFLGAARSLAGERSVAQLQKAQHMLALLKKGGGKLVVEGVDDSTMASFLSDIAGNHPAKERQIVELFAKLVRSVKTRPDIPPEGPVTAPEIASLPALDKTVLANPNAKPQMLEMAWQKGALFRSYLERAVASKPALRQALAHLSGHKGAKDLPSVEFELVPGMDCTDRQFAVYDSQNNRIVFRHELVLAKVEDLVAAFAHEFQHWYDLKIAGERASLDSPTIEIELRAAKAEALANQFLEAVKSGQFASREDPQDLSWADPTVVAEYEQSIAMLHAMHKAVAEAAISERRCASMSRNGMKTTCPSRTRSRRSCGPSRRTASSSAGPSWIATRIPRRSKGG